jgi:heterodisulfide reductase subunit B2
MRAAYYPGCSVSGVARDYKRSIERVCPRLGVELKEVKDWNCCGASAAHASDQVLASGLALRNLQQAGTMGFDQVVTPCAGCYSRLKHAAHDAAAGVEVLHLLQLIVDRVGLDRVAGQVRKPLSGMRLAAYYGCLLTRPSAVMGFDDPEQPTSLDRLLSVLGAETVVWSHKTECCGAGLAASAVDVVAELGGQVLQAAKAAGAQAVVVACPLCQMNLETRQPAMAARLGVELGLPVLYFTQLMGLAFGLSARAVGLSHLHGGALSGIPGLVSIRGA